MTVDTRGIQGRGAQLTQIQLVLALLTATCAEYGTCTLEIEKTHLKQPIENKSVSLCAPEVSSKVPFLQTGNCQALRPCGCQASSDSTNTYQQFSVKTRSLFESILIFCSSAYSLLKLQGFSTPPGHLRSSPHLSALEISERELMLPCCFLVSKFVKSLHKALISLCCCCCECFIWQPWRCGTQFKEQSQETFVVSLQFPFQINYCLVCSKSVQIEKKANARWSIKIK